MRGLEGRRAGVDDAVGNGSNRSMEKIGVVGVDGPSDGVEETIERAVLVGEYVNNAAL